jgi:hypothetical protein
MKAKHLLVVAVAVVASVAWILAQLWTSDVEVQEEISPAAQPEGSAPP